MGVVEGGDQDQPVHWEAKQGSKEKIFVSVRVRPLNSKEIGSNDLADWECINSTTILFKNCLSERSTYPNAYTFDRVFGFGSFTRQVYEEAAKEVALSVLNGINSSVFAYGQTSSGKTYTMGGITQCAVADLYNYIYEHAEREYVVKFGAMEIYNEHVKDLLSTDPTPLRLLDDHERGTVVEKLIEEIVREKTHLLELIAVCEAQRQIGETSLNETSSRSHQILRLTVQSTPRQLTRGNSSMLAATVNFVDLAGSERTTQTQASGTRLKEGSHINRSLLTLGKCIRSLSKGRNGHIPYRDSKLTRILQNSLGGNARTAIICTMSPAHSHLEQSRNTLFFASCAKQVTTNAQVNVVMSDKALVKHLRKELSRLERELTSISSVSAKPDVVSALKEKELQIEKMDKEMKELSRQRDYAEFKLEELISSGERTPSSVSRGSGSHPQNSDSRRTLSWLDDSSLTSYASDAQESVKFLQENEGFDLISHHRELLENFDDNLIPDMSSPQAVNQTVPNFAKSSEDQNPRWKEMTIMKTNSETEEDNCEEVICIEVQAPNSDSIKTSPEEEKEENEKERLEVSENEKRELSENKECDALVKRIKELQMTIECLVSRNSRVEQFFSGSTKSDGSSPKRLSLTRSTSCKAILTSTTPSSPRVDNVSYTSGFNKLMKHEKQKVSNASGDGKRKLSRLAYSLSMKNPTTDELKEDARRSEVSQTSHISSSYAGINADVKLEPDKPTELQTNGTIPEEVEMGVKEEMVDDPSTSKSCETVVKEEMVDDPSTSKSCETVANDSVAVPRQREPMPQRASTSADSSPSWEDEFESQRSKIIELWDVCHIPLVHRTYFFVLFKGDPSDKVYMDVELRRLSFIKNRFSQCQKIALDGQAFTQSSSMRALNQERDVLVKQMYKKILSQEREHLFKKWGIDVNSKQRRLQLARQLWTNTKDLKHVKKSATLVARLIDFTDENQVPKEMFVGPSITAKTLNRRSYSWKT